MAYAAHKSTYIPIMSATSIVIHRGTHSPPKHYNCQPVSKKQHDQILNQKGNAFAFGLTCNYTTNILSLLRLRLHHPTPKWNQIFNYVKYIKYIKREDIIFNFKYLNEYCY